MAQEWYVFRGNEKQGPFSVGQLKQLAADGQIKPGDRLQKDGMDNPVLASAVKGLFPAVEGIDRKTAAVPVAPPKPVKADEATSVVLPSSPRTPTRTREAATQRGGLSSAWLYLRRLGADFMRGGELAGLERELKDATVALGQQVYDVKIGDDRIRAQIVKAQRAIDAAKSANESTRKLEKEKNELLLQLGSGVLDGDAPAGAKDEHDKAREAREAVEAFNREWERVAADPELSPKWKTLPVLSKVVLLGGVALILLSCMGVLVRVGGKRSERETAQAVDGKQSASDGSDDYDKKYNELAAKVTYENVRKIRRGMSEYEVEEILGKSFHKTNDLGKVGYTKTHYGRGRSQAIIVYTGGVVDKIDWIPPH